MADIQFLSELCAVILKEELHGFGQNQLDELYAEYDDITEIATFSLDDFSNKIERIKGKIGDLITIDPSIKRYLKIQNHFYSLWAYLYLEKDRCPNSRDLAKRYKNFVDHVTKIVKLDKTPEFSLFEYDDEANPKIRQAILDYAKNSRGASTDFMPREKRHLGLVAALSET